MARVFVIALCLLTLACAEKKYTQGGGAGPLGEKAILECNSTNQLPNSKYCLTFSWEKAQVGNKPGVALLKIWRPNLADRTPVLVSYGESVEVVLWMPHMGGGHGSDPVTVEPVDVGTFRLKRVFFSMRGPWEIRVFVKNGGTTVDQIYLPFTY